MELLQVSGNFILWIIMVAEVQGGPPSGPRGYRWSEWQSCTPSSGCASLNLRYRTCEFQNNNGASHCTPDEQESEIDPSATQAPVVTTTEKLPTTDITSTTEHLPTADITTTTDNLPTTDITTTTDNLPTADITTTTDNLPTTDITTTTDNLPTTDITTTTDNLPVIETNTTTENGPVVEITTKTATGIYTSTDNLPGISTTSVIDSTSTAINTTAVYSSTDPNTNCFCECNAVSWSVGTLNLTNEEANQLISQLRKQLAVNVSTLSSTVRKKISAPDERISSAAMGYLGTAVLVTLAVTIVGGDLVTLIAKLRT